MAARCLSKTSVTFITGTCHCFEQHSSQQWLLSAAARCTPLIYFPSPPSVYPAGCCSEAARRCYNCRWVNIYRVQWGWCLLGSGGRAFTGSDDIMKSCGDWANICSHSGDRFLAFLNGGGGASGGTKEGSSLNWCPRSQIDALLALLCRYDEWLMALSAILCLLSILAGSGFWQEGLLSFISVIWEASSLRQHELFCLTHSMKWWAVYHIKDVSFRLIMINGQNSYFFRFFLGNSSFLDSWKCRSGEKIRV